MRIEPLPPIAQVRAMRKERFPGTKAGSARRLYAERCNVEEIALALGWRPDRIRRALRRPA